MEKGANNTNIQMKRNPNEHLLNTVKQNEQEQFIEIGQTEQGISIVFYRIRSKIVLLQIDIKSL